MATATAFTTDFADPSFADELIEHSAQCVRIHVEFLFQFCQGSAVVGFEVVLEVSEHDSAWVVSQGVDKGLMRVMACVQGKSRGNLP